MLNKESYEKFKAFSEALNDDKEKATFNKFFNILMQDEVLSNEKMQAVVGIDENDKPVFWDLEKDSLILSYSSSGEGANDFGQDLPIMSLELRFGKDKFAYYVFAGSGAVEWNMLTDSHCLGFCSAFYAYKDNPDPKEYINDLMSVINNRLKMSQEQLANEPFLLFVFGGAHFFGGEINDLLKLLAENARKIKAAVICTERNNLLKETYEPIYNAKHAKFEGAICGEGTLKDENRKFRSECCRLAYFNLCDGKSQKVAFPDYIIYRMLTNIYKKRYL